MAYFRENGGVGSSGSRTYGAMIYHYSYGDSTMIGKDPGGSWYGAAHTYYAKDYGFEKFGSICVFGFMSGTTSKSWSVRFIMSDDRKSFTVYTDTVRNMFGMGFRFTDKIINGIGIKVIGFFTNFSSYVPIDDLFSSGIRGDVYNTSTMGYGIGDGDPAKFVDGAWRSLNY